VKQRDRRALEDRALAFAERYGWDKFDLSRKRIGASIRRWLHSKKIRKLVVAEWERLMAPLVAEWEASEAAMRAGAVRGNRRRFDAVVDAVAHGTFPKDPEMHTQLHRAQFETARQQAKSWDEVEQLNDRFDVGCACVIGIFARDRLLA
jgi:hypothetical protein